MIDRIYLSILAAAQATLPTEGEAILISPTQPKEIDHRI